MLRVKTEVKQEWGLGCVFIGPMAIYYHITTYDTPSALLENKNNPKHLISAVSLVQHLDKLEYKERKIAVSKSALFLIDEEENHVKVITFDSYKSC